MNVGLIRGKLKELEDVQSRLASEELVLASLEMRSGQTFGGIFVFGKKFDLVVMNSRSYGPEAVEALNGVRLGLIAIQKMQVRFFKSQIEGIEFAIKQAAYRKE